MKEALFIGAGTEGAKKIGNSFQPYLNIHGKTCIEYVFDAACNSKLVDKIYLWGNKRRLKRLLHDRLEALKKTNIKATIIIVKKASLIFCLNVRALLFFIIMLITIKI